jgi:hypothetical protein
MQRANAEVHVLLAKARKETKSVKEKVFIIYFLFLLLIPSNDIFVFSFLKLSDTLQMGEVKKNIAVARAKVSLSSFHIILSSFFLISSFLPSYLSALRLNANANLTASCTNKI